VPLRLQRVVRRPLGLAILVGLVLALPFILWAAEIAGDGFPDSGLLGGTFGLVLIACMLGLVFWPAAWAALRDDSVPTKRIGLFALALAAAHAIAFIGITVSESNVYLLAYPLASVIGTYAILRYPSSGSPA